MNKEFVKRLIALVIAVTLLLAVVPLAFAAGKTAATAIDVQVKSVVATALTMKSNPSDLKYFTGEKFSTDGGVVTVTYSDGNTEDVNLSDCEVSGIDTSKAESYNATVKYEGVTLANAFTVEVKDKSIVTATLISPTKLNYIEGEALDVTGGEWSIDYDDGSHNNQPLTLDECAGFDNSKIGEQTVTATLSGTDKTETFKVNVAKKEITKKEINPLPTKTSYKIGKDKNLDTSGGKFVISYNNGKEDVLDFVAADCSGYDLDKIGDYTVTVKKNDQTATYGIKVLDKELTGFTVSTLPTTQTFIEGTTFNCNGGKLTLAYDNGTTDVIDLTSVMCSGYDMNKVGKQNVTVTYGGFTQTYEMTINAKKVVSIAMKTNPTNVDYIEGQTLDVTGGTFDITYDNETTKEGVALSEATCTADMNKIGAQDVKVTYEGAETTYPINILKKQMTAIKLDPAPTKVDYIAGVDTALDVTGGKLTVSYDNDTTASVDVKADMCTGFDAKTLGNQTITVTYTEDEITETTSYDITMKKELSSIKWKTEPTKTSFIQGDKFAVDGIIIPVYSDKSEDPEVEVTTAMCSGQDLNVGGVQTVTVTYEGKTETYTITVDGIAVNTPPTKVEYVKGEGLDLSGLTFIFYINGEARDIPFDPATMSVSGYDANAVGEQKLTITYKYPETGMKYVLKDGVSVTVKDPTPAESTDNGSNNGTTSSTTTDKVTNPKTGAGSESEISYVVLCIATLTACGMVVRIRKTEK